MGNRELFEKNLEVSAWVLGASLFHFELVKYGIILFVLSTLPFIARPKLIDKSLIILMLPFLAILISSLLNGMEWKWLEKRSAYIIFPIVFSFFLDKRSFKLSKRQIFRGLANGSLIFAIFMLMVAVYKSLLNQSIFFYDQIERVDKNYFLHRAFSEPLGQHPTHLSIYFFFSLLILTTQKTMLKNGRLRNFGLVILLGLLFLLQSKLILVMVFVLVLIKLFKKSPTKKGIPLTHKLSVLIFLVLGIYLGTTRIGSLKVEPPDRVTQALFLNEGWNSVNMRFKLNEIGMRMVRQMSADELVFGMGKKEMEARVMQIYQRERLFFFHKNEYGVHNQYLSELLKTGLFGLGSIILLTTLALFFGIKHGYPELIYISMVVIIYCFFEEFLNLQSGVVFTSLFFTIYFKDVFWKE